MSETPDSVGRLARRFEAMTGWLAPRCHRHPVITLAVAGVVTALSLAAARGIKLDTDLVALLPDSFPSVKSLEVLRERFGAVGNLVVLARGKDPKKLQQFADDLRAPLSKLGTVDFVHVRRSDQFFKDRALYYLEVEDLEEIQDRIDETIRYHKKEANPLFVDLEDTGPPSLDFSHLEERRSPLKRSIGGGMKDRGTHFLSEDGHLIGIFIKGKERASDFSFARALIEDAESVLAGVDRAKYGIDEIQIGGRYKKRLEQQSIVERDLGFTSALALALLCLYLVAHFRRISAVILLIAPLCIGLVWLLGITSLLFGTLNILTAFVGAILLGLGIDHGIHLLGRYQHERALGVTEELAIALTFANTGRGVVLAGLTTAVGFSGLAISEFRAFHEFGVIAGLGVGLVVLSYLTVLPALLALLGGLVSRGRSRELAHSRFAGWIARNAKPVFWTSTVAALLLSIYGLEVDFDYDFRTLEGGDIPAYDLDAVIDGLIGHQQSTIVVFTDSPEEERNAAETLRRRVEEAKETTGVDFVIASSDVVPHEQGEKQEVLEELHETLEDVPKESLNEADQKRLEDLKRMASQEPFTFADLPEDVRRQFRARGVVLVFPRVSLSDGLAVLALSDEVRAIPVAGGREVSAAGESMVLADILRMVFRESPIVVSITVGLVFLSMWILLGRLKLALFCMGPAVLTVGGTLGLAALLGVRLNYLNIVILPVLFGMAVDAGVHLMIRGVLSSRDVVESLGETGRAVFGASVTTAMGFGALLLAHHPGLNSFGSLSLIGLSLIVFTSLVWLMSLIAMMTRGDSNER